MIIAGRLLRDRQRSMLWWSLGVLAVVGMMLGLYPSIEGKHEFQRLFEKLPAAIKAMVGTNKQFSIISPEGYLHGRMFGTLAPLLLIIFGIGLGASSVAGAEGDGTLELLLSNPVSRRRVAVERYAVVVGLVVGLGAVFAAATIAFAHIIGGSMARISSVKIIEASFGSVCLALLHASLAFGVGCAVGKRGLAVAVASVVAVGGYLVHVLTASVPSLDSLGSVSPWRWYLGRLVIVDGLGATAVLLPLGLAAVFAVGGSARFERRDLT